MKWNSIFLCLLFTLCFVRCDDGEPGTIVPATKLLTVSVEASYKTDLTENWVIVHDANGALVAFRAFESNEEFVLETDEAISGNIGITFLNFYENGSRKFYHLTSYLNIELGKQAILLSELGSPAPPSGSFNVFVDGFDGLDQISMSNKVGQVCSSSGSDNTVSLDCDVNSAASDYLLQLSDHSGEIRYKVFTNVEPDDTYTVSFAEMSAFDQTIEFSFPESNDVIFTVQGKQADQSFKGFGHFLSLHFNMDYHTKIKAGYLSTLSKYYTLLNITYPDYRYLYSNVGTIPDANIPWPQKSNFSLGSKSINNFSCFSSVPFIWRSSEWLYNSEVGGQLRQVSWKVESPSGSQVFLELPLEFVTLHPLLAFDNLKHTSTTFYTQSESYESYSTKELASEIGPYEPRVAITIW